MEKLRKAMGDRTAYSVSRNCSCVGHQQVENLLSGVTLPWRVSVETAQELIAELPSLSINDFFRPHSKD
jgi:hypothetical protein